MTKKEDLRIRKTRASLYKNFLQLMEEKSFEDISITDICKSSSINRSTFYDHFKDKYELLSGLMKDYKEEIKIHIETDKSFSNVKDYLLEIINLLLIYLEDNLKLYNTLSIIKKKNSLISDLLYDSLLETVTNYLKENYTNKSNISTETIAIFYVSGITNVITEALQNKKTFNREIIQDNLTELIQSPKYLQKKQPIQ